MAEELTIHINPRFNTVRKKFDLCWIKSLRMKKSFALKKE